MEKENLRSAFVAPKKNISPSFIASAKLAFGFGRKNSKSSPPQPLQGTVGPSSLETLAAYVSDAQSTLDFPAAAAESSAVASLSPLSRQALAPFSPLAAYIGAVSTPQPLSPGSGSVASLPAVSVPSPSSSSSSSSRLPDVSGDSYLDYLCTPFKAGEQPTSPLAALPSVSVSSLSVLATLRAEPSAFSSLLATPPLPPDSCNSS